MREMTGRVKTDSHYPSRFRSVSERHRSVKLSHVQLNGYVHTDRNVSVKSRFRSFAVAERECLTGRDGTGPNQCGNLLDSDSEIDDRLLQYASSVCLQRVLPGFSSEIDEKLIEFVRKCMKYSGSVQKEKLWGQIGEELKRAGRFHQLRILKLL